jgi:hypothetical protein
MVSRIAKEPGPRLGSAADRKDSRYSAISSWMVRCSVTDLLCEQAWNKDPCIGVIGVQTGPP